MKGYSKREFNSLIHYNESGNRTGSTKPSFGSGFVTMMLIIIKPVTAKL